MTSLSASSSPLSTSIAIRLVETAFTRSGIQFSPNDDVWEWTDGPFRVYLDFRKITLSDSIPISSLKQTLLVFAKRNSASHLGNLFTAFIHFLAKRAGTTPLLTISATEVSNYSALLKSNEKWRVSTLNVLLQKWVALRLPGVEPDCTDYLRELRKEGNPKGEAVRTRNPIKGPFSEAEYTSLYKAVDTAYGTGDIAQWVAVLTRLLFACGGRISQYASLKVMDFMVKQEGFALNLPQAKTREVHSRSSFKEFDLSPQTGRLLEDYVQDLELLGYDKGGALFPEEVVLEEVPKSPRRKESDLFFGHYDSAGLSKKFSNILATIAPPSERLDFEAMPITTQRFRYTFGTRLAEEGASKTVIADRLGHTDLQNVGVYFEASPKIVENIDKAMSVPLAPLLVRVNYLGRSASIILAGEASCC